MFGNKIPISGEQSRRKEIGGSHQVSSVEENDVLSAQPRVCLTAARARPASAKQRELCIDELLVRTHFLNVVIRWTGLAPWEFEFLSPGCHTFTFLDKPVMVVVTLRAVPLWACGSSLPRRRARGRCRTRREDATGVPRSYETAPC